MHDTCTDSDCSSAVNAIIADLRHDNADLIADLALTADNLRDSRAVTAALRSLWQQRHSTPLVYIAGAYRGRGLDTNTHQNTDDALAMWHALSDAGIDALCPHAVTKGTGHAGKSDAWWLRYTMALMRVCTHVVRLPNDSDGADAECAEAEALGIPVFQADYFDVVPDALLEAVVIEPAGGFCEGTDE